MHKLPIESYDKVCKIDNFQASNIRVLTALIEVFPLK